MELLQKYCQKHKQLFSPSEIEELVLKARGGDIEARNAIINFNLRLAITVSFRYLFTIGFYPRIELDDLVQESIFGMVRAIELYDPAKGAFSTYAVWWMNQGIRRYIDNTKYMVRVPIFASAIQKQYSRLQQQLSERDEDFYLRLLAFENDCSVESIRATLSFRGDQVDSIHAGVNEEGESTTVDLETLTWEPDTTQLDVDVIKKIANRLGERDKKILMLRMENYSLQAIAEECNLSRERVRQIQVQALAKLRSMVNQTKENTWKVPKSQQ